MNYDEYSTLAMKHIDSICYMSDIETYELLYLNQQGMDSFGLQHHEDYQGKKCYQVLQGLDSPCPFCTNHKLEKGVPYEWQHHNPVINHHYFLTDHLIDLEGRPARLEFATDITHHFREVESLEERLDKERTLVSCVQTLTENLAVEDAISQLLATVGNYYQAMRAYIFEYDLTQGLCSNTYEWCLNPEDAAIHTLQNVPISVVDQFNESFESQGEFYISVLDEVVPRTSKLHKLLADQDIEALMVVPLHGRDGEIMGFIGVDNPVAHVPDLSLLISVSLFILNDLTKRRMYEKLDRMNYTDNLTGLNNRQRYMEHLREFEAAPPPSIGIVYADLNGLRPINEQYGQTQGDYHIIHNAMLLKDIFSTYVYRMGGDEFIALCPGVHKSDFQRRVSQLRTRIHLDDRYDMSIGTVFQEGRYQMIHEVSRAEEIMFIEKQRYYSSTFQKGHHYATGAVNTLLEELAQGMFMVYLQAKVDLATGQITGAEALIRKKDESGSLIPPDRFIPIYEREKIIRHVDLFVVETVCRTLRGWIDEGNPLKLSLNLSRVTLTEHEIIDDVEAICQKYNVPVELLDLEVTESSNQIDKLNLQEKINQAKGKGFPVSLDDFGADYSNLLMLTSAQFSQVKLDKSLIENLCEDPKNKIIVEQTIHMCHSLGMDDSLAEGIETQEQRSLLTQVGCRSGQGYLFARPMPIPDFYALFQRQLETGEPLA